MSKAYLVVLRHLMDDFPLALFHAKDYDDPEFRREGQTPQEAAYEAALQHAHEASWHDDVEHPFGVDANTPHSIGLLTFCCGVPTHYSMLREFSNEEPEGDGCDDEGLPAGVGLDDDDEEEGLDAYDEWADI